jgi:hypothetical protein
VARRAAVLGGGHPRLPDLAPRSLVARTGLPELDRRSMFAHIRPPQLPPRIDATTLYLATPGNPDQDAHRPEGRP